MSMTSQSYVWVCVCACVCERARETESGRERALIPKNLSAMSDEYFPQRSLGRTGPIEMPPRSPDSTQRLLSSLRHSRAQLTAGNRGMLAKLKGKPGTSGTQKLVRGSASGFLQKAGKSARLQDVPLPNITILLGSLQTTGLCEPKGSKSGHTHS